MSPIPESPRNEFSRIPRRIDLLGRCFRKALNGWGRASRREYWSFALPAIMFVIGVIVLELTVVNPDSAEVSGFFVSAFLAVLVFILPPLFFVGMRRYHDLGRSGWLYLLHVLTGFGTFYMLFATLGRSEPEPNKHGPVPPEAKL